MGNPIKIFAAREIRFAYLRKGLRKMPLVLPQISLFLAPYNWLCQRFGTASSSKHAAQDRFLRCRFHVRAAFNSLGDCSFASRLFSGMLLIAGNVAQMAMAESPCTRPKESFGGATNRVEIAGACLNALARKPIARWQTNAGREIWLRRRRRLRDCYL